MLFEHRILNGSKSLHDLKSRPQAIVQLFKAPEQFKSQAGGETWFTAKSSRMHSVDGQLSLPHSWPNNRHQRLELSKYDWLSASKMTIDHFQRATNKPLNLLYASIRIVLTPWAVTCRNNYCTSTSLQCHSEMTNKTCTSYDKGEPKLQSNFLSS